MESAAASAKRRHRKSSRLAKAKARTAAITRLQNGGGKRDALAEKMFKDATRRVKVSPELDTPQFCTDWLAISPGEVREAVIMVRGPKRDKNGDIVKRGGAVVETWLEYAAECARRNIPVAL